MIDYELENEIFDHDYEEYINEVNSYPVDDEDQYDDSNIID